MNRSIRHRESRELFKKKSLFVMMVVQWLEERDFVRCQWL
jgi:hypothetical protein